jgi:hypothetical protein
LNGFNGWAQINGRFRLNQFNPWLNAFDASPGHINIESQMDPPIQVRYSG